MYTLGISCYYHDSAAAVLKDGKVIAAVEEERFSRIKFDDGFPKLAINWCLKEAGISAENIDSIVKIRWKFDIKINMLLNLNSRSIKLTSKLRLYL